MSKIISEEDLKELFTKPYGEDAPSRQKWLNFTMIMLFLLIQRKNNRSRFLCQGARKVIKKMR